MNRLKHIHAAVLALTVLGAVVASAAPVDFVGEVQPIFDEHCVKCHGEGRQKSGFRLDVKSEALRGGDHRAPDIVPGNAAGSPVVLRVSSTDTAERMPPEGEGLTAAEIATLTRWINEGAVWPDGVDRVTLKDRRDHWSFKPLSHPLPPETRKTSWPRNDIDRFILARLEQESLSPAPEADRRTWLRRVSFDLTGLPPTPGQLEAFLGDCRGDAYERVVDDLLKSPRYGEHWAQHWLDVVRYADTHGFEVNTERPNAWPYRDYVIEAFNQDTPYDRFIREQIAGDALGQDAATGFLVTASVLLPGQIGKDEPSKRLARQDSLDEIVNNIGQTFLALSIGCARCHDHKFDPIPQRDYYSMQAFVSGVEYRDRELNTPEANAAREEMATLRSREEEIDRRLSDLVPLANSGVKRPPVNARMNVERFAPVKARRVRFTVRATNRLEPCIDELEVFDTAGRNVGLASLGAVPSASGSKTFVGRHELKQVNDGLYGNSRSWMSDVVAGGWVALEFPEEHVIDRVVWGRDREGKFSDRLATSYLVEVAEDGGEWQSVADSGDRREGIASERGNVEFSPEGLTPDEVKEGIALVQERDAIRKRVRSMDEALQIFAGAFRTPDEIHLLSRGNPEQPQEEVVPAVLSALGDLKLPRDTAEQQRRLALADWIASPENPLTARVMVNRVWQGHFGIGLVETASDFGNNGVAPTHPKLLDWLAGEFVRSGWSLKHLHRLIVLSAAYRQSTRSNPEAAARDAGARLLWRYPSRRLEAESIRDSMLAVSGRLNLKMYGRGFDLFDKRGGLTGFNPVESFRGDGLRRMIYAHKVRRETEAVVGAFDCPDAGQSTALRRESVTPIQALNLFNSRFTLEQSEAFAARVATEAGDNPAREIERAYQLALNREPDADELREAEPVVRQHGLATLCRVLFNSNEFLFVP